jgi:UDP-N-acetylmuramate dehydrogenase
MNHPKLSELSTFGIGGAPKAFLKVHTVDEMQTAIRDCVKNQTPYFILGKGSNVLFDQRGFNGLVIQNKIDFFESPSPGVWHVGGGFSFTLLGTRTAQAGYSGLEFASGIPASVGGAIFMNAGANGMETERHLTSVDYVDEKGDLKLLLRSELQFAYRSSSFQKWKGAIVGATFTLTPSDEARGKQIDIIRTRTASQPYSAKSAGCIFRNPFGHFAGKLIEEAGLKGVNVGGAKVSEKHANFIVNDGEATTEEVLELIEKVKKRVYETHQIELESEVRVIPYDPLC